MKLLRKRFSFVILLGSLFLGVLYWNVSRAFFFRKRQLDKYSTLLQEDTYDRYLTESRISNYSIDVHMDAVDENYNDDDDDDVDNDQYPHGVSQSRFNTKQERLEEVVKALSRLSNITNKIVLNKIRLALPKLKPLPSLQVQENSPGVLSTVVPPAVWIRYADSSWNGMTLPVITCEPAGRLGNVMGEYATLYALKHIYNVSAVLTGGMQRKLTKFPKISLLPMPISYHGQDWESVANIGNIYNYSPIELASAGLFGPRKFVMKNTAFEIQLFHQFKKKLQQEFTFSESTLSEANAFLHGVILRRSEMGVENPVLIGFHVRRTDYTKHIKHFGAELPGRSYFERAIEYYRNKFPQRAVFVAASDNMTFLKEDIGHNPDVVFSKGTTPEMDMAILSSCNHSIVTTGSFGFWTGFLTGGEVVYPDVQTQSLYRFSRKMYERSGLSGFTPLAV